MLNEIELVILIGMLVDSLDNIYWVGCSLLDKGLYNLIIILGYCGLLWMYGEEIYYVLLVSVYVIDISGVGDVFIGCFVYEYVLYGDVLKVMEMVFVFVVYSVIGKGM